MQTTLTVTTRGGACPHGAIVIQGIAYEPMDPTFIPIGADVEVLSTNSNRAVVRRVHEDGTRGGNETWVF